MRVTIAFALLLLIAGAAVAQDQASGAGQLPPAAPAGASTIGIRLQAVQAQPDATGIGPYPAIKEPAPNDLDFVVYRPRDLNALGSRKLGVHVWGNGGCSFDGAFARFHLLDIASYGNVSLAHGRILTGPGAPPRAEGGRPQAGGPRATAEGMLAALDWILAENARPGSPYYQRIDPSKVAASGNSCGGLLALKVAQDPRIKTVILQNSGIIPTGAPNSGLGGLTKADLAKLHTPVLYILGGADDIAQPNGMDDFKRIDHLPVFVADRKNAGHFGTFIEPNGRGTEIEIDWLKWQFENDPVASRTFVGEDCRLCHEPGWTVHRKGIK